jgi:hypothetical protein
MRLRGKLILKARVQLEIIDEPQGAEDDRKKLTIRQGKHWVESPPKYENYTPISAKINVFTILPHTP